MSEGKMFKNGTKAVVHVSLPSILPEELERRATLLAALLDTWGWEVLAIGVGDPPKFVQPGIIDVTK
jgi:hypothetical protein